MIYIKILESFQDIHDKHIYRKDKFDTVTEERYEEIQKNAIKWNKELIRLATEEEIKANFPDTEVEEPEKATEGSEEQEESSDIVAEHEEPKDTEIEESEKATESSEEQEEPKTNKKTSSRRK